MKKNNSLFSIEAVPRWILVLFIGFSFANLMAAPDIPDVAKTKVTAVCASPGIAISSFVAQSTTSTTKGIAYDAKKSGTTTQKMADVAKNDGKIIYLTEKNDVFISSPVATLGGSFVENVTGFASLDGISEITTVEETQIVGITEVMLKNPMTSATAESNLNKNLIVIMNPQNFAPRTANATGLKSMKWSDA